MSLSSPGPLVSIVLPVRNGADTLEGVVRSVLAQTHRNLELVISDNASTDSTQEVCRRLASTDARVVYRRQSTNVGLLNNFISAAEATTGDYLRWIGDDDALEPEYVARVLDSFAEDPRRVLVTTQILYRDADGAETLDTDYDPAAMSSEDPIDRFASMLRLLTAGFATIDPIYGMIRRDLASIPRRNMLREDQVFAARLALAGPWGHVAEPLAVRRRDESGAAGLARLLGVPGWHRHVRVLLQCRELSRWVECSALERPQRRRAQTEILKFYVRGHGVRARRGVARLERLTPVPRLASRGAS